TLRLVADLGGDYGSFAGADIKQLTFLAGVRLVGRQPGRLQPFGELLVGGAHSTSTFADISASTTAWGGCVGGGADYRITGRGSARGQLHGLLLPGNGSWDFAPRVSLGLSSRFRR